MNFTKEDMERVSILYDANFELLHKAVNRGDTKNHAKFLQEERRLNALDIKIRKVVGYTERLRRINEGA